MSKWVHDLVMDAQLDYIIANADRLCLCSAQPADYTEATTTYDGSAGKYKLAIHTLTGGDFTKDDGDTSGRKVTIAAQAGVDGDATAFGNFIALCDSSNSRLLVVTTCTTQSCTLGDVINFPAWDYEIIDPA